MDMQVRVTLMTQPLRFWLNSRTLVECTDPLRGGARRTPTVSSRVRWHAVSAVYADVRLRIPMTRNNDEGTWCS